MVLVLMTGRPVLLGELPELADALVAAWLPGTEAEGITDVLFGDEDFAGKLPYTRPVMSWLSVALDKPSTRITQEDVDRLLAGK